MKKLLFIIAATFFSMTAIAFAAPVSNIYRSIVPEADNTYYIGTTSPSNLRYNGNFNDLTITGTCTGCGSGGASYPFPLTSNATSTLTQFNGGLTAFASSTIGNGTQTGGLTVSGGATTTGNAYFGGRAAITGNTTLGGTLQFTGYSASPQMFAGDSTTGIHFDGPGIMSFHGSGSQQGILTSTNKWGFGATSTPTAKLSLAGDSNGTIPVLLVSTSTASATSTVFAINSAGNVSINNGATLTISALADGCLQTASGLFTSVGCSTIGSAFPFTPTTNYGVAVNSTSTPIWFTAGLMASSTSYFPGSGIWNSSGNVGIATTSPMGPFAIGHATNPVYFDTSNILHIGGTENIFSSSMTTFDIRDNSVSTTYSGITINNWNSSTALGPVVHFGRSRSGTVGTYSPALAGDVLGAIAFTGDDGDSSWNRAAMIVAFAEQDFTPAVGYGSLRFYTANGASVPTERMRLSSVGNLGIATTDPINKLTISATTSTDITNGQQINLRSLRTTINTTNSLIGGITFTSNDTNLTAPGLVVSGVTSLANETHTGATQGTDLVFTTTGTGGTATNTEKVRITGAGNVGIGTTTPDIAGTTLDTLVIGTASAINAGIVLDLGAAGTGAYGFAIDGTINSRISYSAASKAMSFFANSLTAQMTLVSSGNVGIGTTTPLSLLNVAGATAPKITISDTNASTNEKHWFVESSSGVFSIGTTSDALTTGTFRPFTISSLGNVVISAITTTARFVISGIAAAFTPSIEGEIGIDTTSNQFKFFSGGAVRVVAPDVDQAFLFASSTLGAGTTTLKVSGYYRGSTFAQFGCTSSGGGTFVAQLGDSTSSSTPVVSGTNNTTTFTALSSNNTFTSGEAVYYAIGSVSGTVTNPSCSFNRTITAD